MGTYRMFTGEDGQTHCEEIDISKTPDWIQGLPTNHITILFTEISTQDNSYQISFYN